MAIGENEAVTSVTSSGLSDNRMLFSDRVFQACINRVELRVLGALGYCGLHRFYRSLLGSVSADRIDYAESTEKHTEKHSEKSANQKFNNKDQ